MAENTKAAAQKVGVNPDQVDMVTKVALTVAHAADNLWQIVNKDDRVSEATKRLLKAWKEASKLRTPEARLRAQLDEVDRFVDNAETGAGARLVREGQAAGWRARAQQIRAKIPLVESMKGRARAKHLRALSKRAEALLVEMVHADIENGVD